MPVPCSPAPVFFSNLYSPVAAASSVASNASGVKGTALAFWSASAWKPLSATDLQSISRIMVSDNEPRSSFCYCNLFISLITWAWALHTSGFRMVSPLLKLEHGFFLTSVATFLFNAQRHLCRLLIQGIITWQFKRFMMFWFIKV